MIGILVRRPEKTENKVVQQTDSAAPRLLDRQIELKPSGRQRPGARMEALS